MHVCVFESWHLEGSQVGGLLYLPDLCLTACYYFSLSESPCVCFLCTVSRGGFENLLGVEIILLAFVEMINMLDCVSEI